MWKQYVKDYFDFTARERTGILILLALIVVFNILPLVHHVFQKQEDVDHEKVNAFFALQTDSVEFERIGKANSASAQSRRQVRLFYFDPNSISKEKWMELGVKEKTAQTIHNYISKGGYFGSADDLHKIYGLQDKEVERLKAFVRIKEKKSARYIGTEEPVSEARSYSNTYAPKVPAVVDVNTADTLQLVALPGIGSRLAARILNFREKLGGFYSVSQVAETYFLPDSTFKKIRPFLKVSGNIRTININRSDYAGLSTHPYISGRVANAIVQFRKQHGDFQSLSELKKIEIISDSLYDKVAPYLTF